MDRKLLKTIIRKISKRSNISNYILEKDYYVCLVLKDLSLKQDKLQAYFKGGTAVYKILDNFNRFSEDIDLTVKVNDDESNNSNKTRLKKSALGYNIPNLELIKEETVDKKGSITAFYKYESLFGTGNLFKSGKIQIEATSFTVSEPVNVYEIEPLIYKYATDDEKKILKEYGINPFSIGIITLERIFVDKIFAAEFYYEREMYRDFAKHIYDIVTMMKDDKIKALLKKREEFLKLVEYKRQEEKVRLGGIPDNKRILDFSYLKLHFGREVSQALNEMQKIYVFDDVNKMTINYVEKALSELVEKLKIILN